MRAAQGEQQQPTFDADAYAMLLEERNAFFDGKKFFDNAIMGSAERCIEQIREIRNVLGNVQIALKPASTQHETNKAMLRRFVEVIYPNIEGVAIEA